MTLTSTDKMAAKNAIVKVIVNTSTAAKYNIALPATAEAAHAQGELLKVA